MSFEFNPFTSRFDIVGLGASKTLPYITPEEYGAAGDGATDDTAAIQAAIDQSAISFKPVLLRQKVVYRVSSITMKERTAMLSLGYRDGGAVLKSNGADPLIALPVTAGETYIRVYGLVLNGNNTASCLVQSNANTFFELENCGLYSCAIGVDHSAGGMFNKIINNRIETVIGIKISYISNLMLIQRNYFGGAGQDFGIVSDTSNESDCIEIVDNSFEGPGTCCIRYLASVNNQNLTCNIVRNRFDTRTSHSLIHIGETVSVNIEGNSIASAQDHLIYIDGRRCAIKDNYFASSADSAIYLSALSVGNETYGQKWCTGGDACASEYEDLGTNNRRYPSEKIGDTVISASAGSILFAGASGVLAQDNANLFWDDTNNRLGIGTTAPDRTLEINQATGQCLRLTYNDANGSAASYADFTVSMGGNLTLTPSSGGTIIRYIYTESLTPNNLPSPINVNGNFGFLGDFGTYFGDSGNFYIHYTGGNPTFTTTSGTFTFNAGLTATEVVGTTQITSPALRLTSSTPSTLAGDVNNWDVGNKSFIRASGGAADRIVTGILASGVADGHVMFITNIGTTNKLSFANESGSSTAANRILTSTAGTVEITSYHSIQLIYDATSARWRELSHF